MIHAAARINDLSFRCAAAQDLMLSRHFSRCERAQRKNQIYRMGSEPPSAPQHKHLFRGCLNVSCRHRRTATSHLQRMHTFRQFCGKTTYCWCRKWGSKLSASAFLIRFCAFAAVQERSWLVCGGFGRLRRGGIRHLHHMALVIEAFPTQGCV